MSEIRQMPRGAKSVGFALIATVTFSGLFAADRLEEQPVINEAVSIEITGTTLNQQLGSVAITEPVAAEPLPQPEASTVPEPISAPEPEPVPTTTAPEAAPVTVETEAPVVSGEGTDLGVFESTCYSETGSTASGEPAGPGSIAVDPRVIPMGTRLWVEGYGEGVAMDTGGAIKGRIIDVWIASEEDCENSWGRHDVQVRQI